MKKNIIIMFFLMSITLYGQEQEVLPTRMDEADKIENRNSLSAIKDWLIPVSTFISLLTLSIGAWLSLKEYRLKLESEQRLNKSTEVEMDVKLMKGFTELLALAHGRKGSYLSEKAVEQLFTNNLISDEDLQNPQKLNRVLEEVAILNIFSGSAEQSAFIAAVTNLALKHEILNMPTIQALETMKGFLPELAEKYLEILSQKNTNSC
jgi:hypothetical protein